MGDGLDRPQEQVRSAWSYLFASGAAILLVRGLGTAAGAVQTIILGRMLGAEAFGFYGYVVVVLRLLAIPIANGWATLLLRGTSTARHDGSWPSVKGLMRRGAQLSALLSTLALAVALGVWWQMGDDAVPLLDTPFLVLLAAVFFFDQLSALRMGLLRGLNHPVWGQSPEMLVRPVVIVAVFLMLALLDPPASVEHAFWALLAGAVLSAAVGGAVLLRKTPAPMVQAPPAFETRAWVGRSSILAGNAALVTFAMQIDMLLLGAFGSFEQAGIYRVAVQVATLSGFVYTALNMLAMERFGYFLASGDAVRLRRTTTTLSRLSFLGSLPVPVLFLFWGREILALLFGHGFAPALEPLAYLFALQVLTAFAGSAYSLLVMNRAEGQLLGQTAVALALNTVLCLAMIPTFGATGAAVASLVSMGALRLANWITVRRQVGIDASIFGLHRPP